MGDTQERTGGAEDFVEQLNLYDRGIAISLRPTRMGKGEIIQVLSGLSNILARLADELNERYNEEFKDALIPDDPRVERREEV